MARRFLANVCSECGRTYKPTSPKQHRCKACSPWFKKRQKLEGRVCGACSKRYDATRGNQKHCADCRDKQARLTRQKNRLRRAGGHYYPLKGRTCVECGAIFDAGGPNQHRCGGCGEEHKRKKKREAYEKARPGSIPLENRICENCGDAYNATGGQQKYCLGESCTRDRRRQGNQKNGPLEARFCNRCGGIFDATHGGQLACVKCAKETGAMVTGYLPAPQIGNWAELTCMADLISKGFFVGQMQAASPFDIVAARTNGEVLRVEVKRCRLRKDGVPLSRKLWDTTKFDVFCGIDKATSRIVYCNASWEPIDINDLI